MAIEDYISFEQAARPPNMPMPDMMGEELVTDVPPVQAAVEPTPLAPRLPAHRLLDMYMAWEQAKEQEIQEAYSASRYYHGKQWSDSELKALKRRKQPATVKNRIKRKVDFLVGIEQSQRRDPKGVPRNPSGEKAAYVGTASLRFVEDVNKGQAIFSDGANDGLIRGIGVHKCVAARMPKGVEIKKTQVRSDEFFYDPRALRWDFDDALHMGEARWMDIEQAKELLPFAAEQIESMATSALVGASGGVVPQIFDKERSWVDPNVRRIFIIEIWYKFQGNWMWDFVVGSISLCPETMDCLSPYTNEDGATVHPYDAWSPYVDERGDRYGVVRDMIPIQDEINKRSSKALHLLTVRQTKAQKGAVDDVDKMKAELAKPDGHVETNPGKDVELLEQTAQIQGNLELLQEAKSEIENLGPNPGLIGRGVEKQSGRAILAQQNSGMTELSPVFERIREWKLRVYRRDWNMIRQFWTSERVIRVSGDPDAIQHLHINRPVVDQMGQVVGMENAVAEIDIDIILDEGPDTVTMREELMEQLSQLGPGVVPPELLIELSNIGEKEQILRKMAEFKAPPPEMQELAKRMSQLEELLAATKVDQAQADVESKRAGTIKTLAEIGLPPEMAMQAFPFYYREPTTLDEAKGMLGMGQPQNLLAGPPPMDGAPPPGMPPPNGLAPEPPPDGLQGLPTPPIASDFLEASSTPWVQ